MSHFPRTHWRKTGSQGGSPLNTLPWNAMRAPSLPCALGRVISRSGRAGVVVVLACWLAQADAAAAASDSAQVAQPERVARLGFAYAPPDADVRAGAQPAAALDLEPADSDVVRLPKYEVKERPIVLTEDELLTPQGRVALAKQRYLTPVYRKVFGPLAAVASLLNNPLGGWNPNGPEALAIYYDNLNYQRRKELEELTGIAALADEVRKDKTEAARRRSDAAKGGKR